MTFVIENHHHFAFKTSLFSIHFIIIQYDLNTLKRPRPAPKIDLLLFLVHKKEKVIGSLRN